VNSAEASRLLEGAVPPAAGTWADLGAGDGTFTAALARRIGPGSRIFAVDRDAAALRRLMRRERPPAVDVIPVAADFTSAFEIPGLGNAPLDGMLLANALHFVPDAGPVLAGLTGRLRPGGRVVVVEYDRRRGNPWVPYPITADRLAPLATEAGLTPPVVTARKRSAYGGDIYVAVATRLSRGA
jgi:SAM-dependent methyltransferase